eukprot:c37318_g1_i1 orf=57-1565(+)
MLSTCCALQASPYPPALSVTPCKCSTFSKLFTSRQLNLPPSSRPIRPAILSAIAHTDNDTAGIDDYKLGIQKNPKHSEPSEKLVTIRDVCNSMIPEEFLQRAEQLGFVYPTDVQAQALPALLSGQDCILHSQTGSGKTLCYLFAILAKINKRRAAVQAIVVVPTRELGMQVVREARKFGKRNDVEEKDKPGSSLSMVSLNVMALLDGGSLSRQKSWLKADPPEVIVGTLPCICKMIETKNLKTNAVSTLVIDEVDAMFGLTQHAGLLRTLLTIFTVAQNRQTILASATIPQHIQFIRKCISEKWVKENVIHVQANRINKMPPSLLHRHVICEREQKLEMLNTVLHADRPKAAIIFVNEQSEASKRKGLLQSADVIAGLLTSSFLRDTNHNSSYREPLVLREDSNINARTSILADFPDEKNLLIATDLAGRGLNIPEVTHVYNFDLPPTATAYVHRGGRTARRPLDLNQGTVTTFVTEQEMFVFQRYQNEIMFNSAHFEINVD